MGVRATHKSAALYADDTSSSSSSYNSSSEDDTSEGAQTIFPPVEANPAPALPNGLVLPGSGGMDALAAAVAAAAPPHAENLPWDYQTRLSFQLVPETASSLNAWYGPWHKVLNLLFKHELGFEVAPQHLSKKDYGLFYIVSYRKMPVLFIEMQLHLDLNCMADRASADRRIRRRFVTMLEINKMLKLYGISAFGTEFARYCMDYGTNRIHPRQRRVRSSPTDTAPKDRWSHNVMSMEGEAVLQAMASKIADKLPMALGRL